MGLYLFLGIMFLILLMTPFICSMTNKEYRKKFFASLKKKKTWVIISCILVSPFVLYAVITLILFVVRGDSFTAYHEYVGNYHFIRYEDAYYVEVTDENELREIEELTMNQWVYNEERVTTEPIGFPYYHYWLPDLILGHLRTTVDNEYIKISSLGYEGIWQRVEE